MDEPYNTFTNPAAFERWLSDQNDDDVFEDGTSGAQCIVGTWARTFWENAEVGYDYLFLGPDVWDLADWQRVLGRLDGELSQSRLYREQSPEITVAEARLLWEMTPTIPLDLSFPRNVNKVGILTEEDE